MRSITTDEIAFNNYIKRFGNYKTFKVDDFDKDEELQELFNLFTLQSNELMRSDIFRKRLDKYYENSNIKQKDMFDTVGSVKKYKIKKGKKVEYIEKTSNGLLIEELFKLTNSKAISKSSKKIKKPSQISMIIYDTKYGRLLPYYSHKDTLKRNQEFSDKLRGKKRKTLDEEIKEKSISSKKQAFENGILRKKIEEWHYYCIAINEVKAFIQLRYKSWTLKRHARFKELAEEFQVLNSCVYMKKAFEDIADTYRALNKFQEYKIEKLLNFDLPNINTRKIAKEITNNLISPYK